MAQYMSMDHLRFLLYEVLEVDKLCELPRFQDHDKEGFDILLTSVKDYADQFMYPCFRECDEKGAYYEDGKIIVPEQVGEYMKASGENGTIGMTFDYEVGGMQLPHVVEVSCGHIAEAANNHLTGYSGLTNGSANLIVTFGSQELIDTYVPNMLAGKWGGTMCLTEPQAGSSLSDIVASAKLNDDGSYSIEGQKIFISGGDHEYSENFVHLVLARIEGAPAGTKGISLFVVPKHRPENGELVPNDVVTAGDFQKMGQRGYCTTHLVFGEENNCKGWLVGPENKGLLCMFQMMNAARIDVGTTAASVASAAYYASLQYAKERPQGRRIQSGGAKKGDAPQTTIINHPDVRRMLLLQKSIVEGSLSLCLLAAKYQDLAEHGPEETRTMYHDLLELLTPMVKTFPAEKGQVAISNGLQILGGYGYCSEFSLQQYYRDVRIMTIYEGTTGIQSLDLLGRKVVAKNGEVMKNFTKEIIETIKAASNYDDLKPYAEALKNASKTLESTLMHLLQFAMSGEHERYISDASIFMELMSTVTIAWQWLHMATIAKTSLVTGNTHLSTEFYENKIHTMKFYFKYELPKIKGHMETLKHQDSLTILEENKTILA